MLEPAPWETIKPKRLVAGVDTGIKGGVSIVNATTERLESCMHMPLREQTVGGKIRYRMDIGGIDELINLMAVLGVEVVVVENPGAGFGAGGRELGEGLGIWRALLWKAEMRIELPTAAKWKKAMVCPANKKEACFRAETLFPRDRDKLLSDPRRLRHDGKSESAMIALYGCRLLSTS